MKKLGKKVISLILALTIINSTVTSSVAISTIDFLKLNDQEITNNVSTETENQEEKSNSQNLRGGGTLYQNNAINIYNIAQLKAIGTDKIVYSGDSDEATFGSGEMIVDNDNIITYSLSANYRLMNDIVLDNRDMWCLPEGFIGNFVNENISENNPVYDYANDRIYIYHSYQLETILSDTGDKEPVMSKDANPSTYGMGQFIYANTEKYVTYSSKQQYVLAKSFTAQRPQLADGTMGLNTEDAEGRDFKGQVIWADKNDNNKEYILIGNEEQLRAIGTGRGVDGQSDPLKDPEVIGAVYQAILGGPEGVGWKNDYDKNDQPILLYGGDADLKQSQNGKKDYKFQEIDKKDNHLSKYDGIYIGYSREARSQIQTGENAGQIDLEKIHVGTGHRYSTTENYIVFRNIDFSAAGENSDGQDTNWNPLMFSGTMQGRLAMQSNQAVTFSNIKVVQSGELDMQKNLGIGFFGTLASERSDYVKSKGKVSVSYINLKSINVDNQSTKVKSNMTLISGLVKLLGGVLGLLLGPILKLVGLESLDDLLKNLVDHGEKDPTNFATGGFAGRVYGEVSISNCRVEDLTISNVKDITGGFVGSSEGMTQYEGLTGLLNGLTTLLEHLLNIIPFLGLGDLITILLDGGLLDVSKLIPVGYYNPTISDCSVVGINSNTKKLGNENTNYNGGFVGKQVGTFITNANVTADGLTINGTNFVGGFSGVTVNAEIKGALNDLGVNLPDGLINQSVIINSNVKGVSAINAAKSYAGGFVGALANSYAIDCGVADLQAVTAKNDYAAGFAGFSSLGSAISLGEILGSSSDDNLLSVVKDLLVTLLSTGSSDATDILSLVGVSPSVIAGVNVAGDSNGLEISADNYAGGIVGRGDGTKIINSSSTNLLELRPFKKGKITYSGTERASSITNLLSVHANTDYAGGIGGFMGTASVGGVLDTTVAIARYIPFQVENVSINKNIPEDSKFSFEVSAGNNYAGGALGQGIGGNVTNVEIDNIAKVTAENYAGGFAGSAGTGSLASAGGLNVLGLIKINNLLSVAEGVNLDIKDSRVTGGKDGLIVESTGTNNPNDSEVERFYAGGFAGESRSSDITNSHVTNLKSVTADDNNGFAGGFSGSALTGGLAQITSNDQNVLSLLGIDGLLKAIPYLIPTFTNTTVTFISNNNNPQVSGASAGGFIGEMQSGTVDNSGISNNPYAVFGIENVEGKYYAGGFAGKSYSGGLAKAVGGLSLLGGLNINVSNLLDVLNVYIPKINSAGVSSEGLIVLTTAIDGLDSYSGSAGGYLGYGSGVQINNSSVNKLKHTKVNLSNYYDDSSKYAVDAPRDAGGYVGKLDIGNAASLGSVDLLSTVGLTGLAQVLDVVASKIENSDVRGAVGGYSVRANGNIEDNNAIVGNAGGFAGSIYGSSIQNSNAYNFENIVGQETAGGYAGRIEPGNVANIVDNTKILGGLIEASSLASVVQSFIPMIYNSKTTSIPCGGVVYAKGISDDVKARGMAGGYVGYNLGGRIAGNTIPQWIEAEANRIENEEEKNALLNSVFQQTCSAYRIRMVYGYEFAGGFTGKMENANAVDTGSLKLLYGLIKLDNPITAIGAVYPTETNTAVYGPLRGLTLDEWNGWVKGVGNKGSYGQWVKEVATAEELNQLIEKYAYGYEVSTGRTAAGNLASQGGVAGGYVGRMDGGVITSAKATDLKSSTALRSSGGFVGEMITAGVANAGKIDIAGIDVLGDLGGLLNVFVPSIEKSSITGYRSGMTIKTTGVDHKNFEGNAGGFVGSMVGGQINVHGTSTVDNCSVNNLKLVQGSYAIGGFAGSILPGSAANVNIASNKGLLNKILAPLISSAGDLAKLLNATVSTVKYASVNSSNAAGFVIDGKYGTNKYAYAAGGFAGNVSGAVLGSRDDLADVTTLSVNNVQSVIGGEHVGGFLGLGDVASVAQVGETTKNTILDLIKLGEIDVLDAFRTYVYNGKVTGAKNGLNVSANTEQKHGTSTSTVYTGNAGGFIGSLLNGSVKNSRVTGINSVKSLNYAGGFIGHMGKSGTVDIDEIGTGSALEGLLNGTAGVLDVFGSHADNCKAEGIANGGFTVQSSGGSESLAGGFAGNGDLARIDDCHVSDLKQVFSDLTAGGFVGETSYAYLAEVNLSSPALLNPILTVINKLLDILYVDDLENLDAIKIDFLGKLLSIDILADGNLLSVTLLGIPITVSLARKTGDMTSDLAKITIGDSYIEVPCHEGKGNHINEEDQDNIKIGLIKANRTKITNSTVTGVEKGYDVFGSGATNSKDGVGEGYAGGFAGHNNEGLLENNEMIRADTIRGADNQIGEFVGKTDLNSTYDFNKVYGIEGNNNVYHVYRIYDDDGLNYLYKDASEVIDKETGEILKDQQVLLAHYTPQEGANPDYYDYKITHMNAFVGNRPVQYLNNHSDWENVYQTTDYKIVKFATKIYISAAQTDLMTGAVLDDNIFDPIKEEGAMQDPCYGDNIDLTIQKLWIDDNNIDNNRPSEVTVTINRYEIDQTGNKIENTDTTLEQKITMTINDADYDTNSWSTSVNLPLYSSTGNKYEYEVVENEINGYIAFYDKSADSYTFYITNYRTTSIIDGDSIVIDYGLPVTVDVLTNDRAYNDEVINGKLAGVGMRDANTTVDSVSDTNNFSSSTIGKYGDAIIDDENGNITYTPTNMKMASFEKLMYSVQVDKTNTKNNQNYIYGTLDVIPATQIYYEDSFEAAVSYAQGTLKDDVAANVKPENYKWEVIGTTDSNRHQDTTRPGTNQIIKDTFKYTDLYGFDTNYLNDATYGDGSSHKVTVDSNFKTFPSISFTFTGTGFDVISLTSNQTGTIITRLYKCDENGIAAKFPIRSWVVDTYYGYKYDSTTQTWEVDNQDTDNALYQVPIIRSDHNGVEPQNSLEYGTYKVTITLTYSNVIDQTDNRNNGYDFYFDGVRIYNSADKNAQDYKVIADAYKLDKEKNPQILEIRDLIIKDSEDDSILHDRPQTGFGFIDGESAGVTLADYLHYGPKNETYIDKGQAISFHLESDYLPDSVQFGAKIAKGNNLKIRIGCGVKEIIDNKETWKYYRKEDVAVNSASELYRSISDQCIWESYQDSNGKTKYRTKYPVVIANYSQNSGDIVSLTNIKLTGAPDPKTSTETPATFAAYVNMDVVKAAYSLLRSQFVKNVTVKYVDQAGQKIMDDVDSTFTTNSNYNVEDLINKTIDGYTKVKVEGDSVQGIADDNKVITVIYAKNYQLTVNYVDKNGHKIAESYVDNGALSGNEYDLTEYSNKAVDGYTVKEVTGDDLKGIVDGNKEITITYLENFDITVEYIDQKGNKLTEAYSISDIDGNSYDVSKFAEKEIAGYTVIKVQGDLKGNVDGDKVIKVVYAKNYQLIVKYVDENNIELAQTVVITRVDGNEYDLTEYSNKAVDGYTIKEVTGDDLKGIVDGNKIIQVIYTKDEVGTGEENNSGNHSNENTDNSKLVEKINSTKTGDNYNIILPIIGVCLSIVILAGVLQIKRQRKEN